MHILILFVSLLFHGAAGRETAVKPWEFLELREKDAEMEVEWSDDFGHPSRLLYNYSGPIKKLTIYCSGAIYDTGLKAERIYICVTGINNSPHDVPCAYVGPNKKESSFYARGTVLLNLKYDSTNEQGIGTFKDIPITESFGAAWIYCRATPGGHDLGVVWRETNHLLVADLRSVEHGDLHPEYWSFDLNANNNSHYMIGAKINDLDSVSALYDLYMGSSYKSNWLPATIFPFEWFVCPNLDHAACYKNKSNALYDIAYRQLQGRWSPNYINNEFNLIPGGITKEVYQLIEDKYFTLFLRGRLFRVFRKCRVIPKWKNAPRLLETWIAVYYQFLWNDTEVSLYSFEPGITAFQSPVQQKFMYDGKLGYMAIEEGKTYPKLGVSVVRHLGNGLKTLRFQGPYTQYTTGLYQAVFIGKGLNKTIERSISVLPYFRIIKDLYKFYTMEPKDIKIVCPTFFENTNPFLFMTIEMEIFGIQTRYDRFVASYDDEFWVKHRIRKMNRLLRGHFQRPIELHISKLNVGNVTHPSRRTGTLKNFFYRPDLGNRFTLTCCAYPYRRQADSKFESLAPSNTPWVRTEMLFQVLPVPRLKIIFLQYPCLEICIMLCDFAEKKQFVAEGIVMKIEWNIDGKPVELGDDEYAFFPMNPVPQMQCSVTFYNPQQMDTPLKKITTSLDFGTANLTVIQPESSAEKYQHFSNIIVYSLVLLFQMLMI